MKMNRNDDGRDGARAVPSGERVAMQTSAPVASAPALDRANYGHNVDARDRPISDISTEDGIALIKILKALRECPK